MIYVASSWRNECQPSVVHELRESGFEVYDFRNPTIFDRGFHWSDIDPLWEIWDFESYKVGLEHELAKKGFELDREAVENCDACVLVLPCGRSAHLELGHIVGQGKPGFIFYPPGESIEPELMYKWAELHNDIEELALALDMQSKP